MTTITFLGGEATGNVGSVQWGRFTFELNRAVVCDDVHIIAKASANRFFHVNGGGGKVAVEMPADAGPEDAGEAVAAPTALPEPPRAPLTPVELAETTMPFFAFRAEAAKFLGESTPAKKGEIIAALKALVAA